MQIDNGKTTPPHGDPENPLKYCRVYLRRTALGSLQVMRGPWERYEAAIKDRGWHSRGGRTAWIEPVLS